MCILINTNVQKAIMVNKVINLPVIIFSKDQFNLVILSNNKTIKIWGGLGNQLFQYAFGKYLEKNFIYNISFNISFYNNELSKKKFNLNDLLVNFS